MSQWKQRAILAAAAPILALAAASAHAQATRTWVSGVGDDVNPCSRTAPCKTFAGAISKTAAGGEINALDPGGYGTLTITKSMTVDGSSTHASILNSGGINGINVNCVSEPTCIVTLRNLSINGAGSTMGLNGIRFLLGAQLHLENVNIMNDSGHGLSIEPSGAAVVYLRNVSIRNAGTGAILVKPSGLGTVNATFENVTMDDNGRGLRVEDRSRVTVRNSRASGNGANGFVAMATAGGGVGLTLDTCLANGNGATGIYAGAGATVDFFNSTVYSNLDGLQTASGGQIISRGGNRVFGNYNSDGAPTGTSGPI